MIKRPQLNSLLRALALAGAAALYRVGQRRR